MINANLHFIYYFYSFHITFDIFIYGASWRVKLINCLGTIFVFINLIIFEELLLLDLFDKLKKKINCFHVLVFVLYALFFFFEKK